MGKIIFCIWTKFTSWRQSDQYEHKRNFFTNVAETEKSVWDYTGADWADGSRYLNDWWEVKKWARIERATAWCRRALKDIRVVRVRKDYQRKKATFKCFESWSAKTLSDQINDFGLGQELKSSITNRWGNVNPTQSWQYKGAN